MNDAERLDGLEALCHRTAYQNAQRPVVTVTSDMHFNAGRCALYVRDLTGNVIASGSGTVREAIDTTLLALKEEPKE